MSKSNNTSVKPQRVGVQPYPIDVSIAGSSVIQGKIKKLTVFGFLVELAEHLVNVGDEYKATFVLPVYNKRLTTTVKTIKTYDAYKGKGVDSVASHIAEFHFVNLVEIQKEAIRKFLLKIKQI